MRVGSKGKIVVVPFHTKNINGGSIGTALLFLNLVINLLAPEFGI
jgi:hypothetical protein